MLRKTGRLWNTPACNSVTVRCWGDAPRSLSNARLEVADRPPGTLFASQSLLTKKQISFAPGWRRPAAVAPDPAIDCLGRTPAAAPRDRKPERRQLSQWWFFVRSRIFL